MIQSCAHLCQTQEKPKTAYQGESKPVTASTEQFETKSFPNEPHVIANMVAIVQPELETHLRHKIAVQLSKAIKKYKINPQIMVAIIDTESNFNTEKVSETGDFSLAQINPEIWNKEFERMKLKTIDKNKLIKNQQYALNKMAEILEIIKKRHGRRDPYWYARYHSNTKDYKKDYLEKLKLRFKMLASVQDLTKKNMRLKSILRDKQA